MSGERRTVAPDKLSQVAERPVSARRELDVVAIREANRLDAMASALIPALDLALDRGQGHLDANEKLRVTIRRLGPAGDPAVIEAWEYCRAAERLYWSCVGRIEALIHQIVRELGVPHRLHEDAFQSGAYGAFRGALRFDPESTYAFNTYALHWAKHEIRDRYGAEFSPAHVPHADRAKVRKAGDARGVSLDAPVFDDGGSRLFGDTLPHPGEPPDEALDRIRSVDRLPAAIEQLPEMEAHVVALRFGFRGHEPHSSLETAAAIGCSRGWMAILQRQGLDRLAELLRQPNGREG